MNPDLLCAAVQEAPVYLDRFDRRHYDEAFREYVERFGPAYLEAGRETGGDEEALTALAESILDRLEAGWKRRRFWDRSAVRANEKQMVVAYLSPMLLGLEEPTCLCLAKTLRDRWTARWPKDGYGIAPFTKIQAGFRYAIAGIDLPDPERERRRDDDVL